MDGNDDPKDGSDLCLPPSMFNSIRNKSASCNTIFLGSSLYAVGESAHVEAEIVHILLPKSVAVSRCARMEWYLNHLNKTISVPKDFKMVNIQGILFCQTCYQILSICS